MPSDPASPTPPASPAASAPAPQATVKVDRSQLEEFLRRTGNNPPPDQSTVKIDSGQVEQFLRKQVPPGSKEPISSQATVQVDRSEINHFLQQSAAQTLKPAAPAAPPPQQVTFQNAELPPQPDFSSFDFPPPPSASPDDAFMAPDPEFGGDDGFDFPPPPEEPIATTPLKATPPAPTPPPPAPTQAGKPTPPRPATPSLAADLFQASVDGNIYPDLGLPVLERWIQEGRLLETDLIAPNGSETYREARQYPEIKVFFDKYFGAGTIEATTVKKGFFARLFSKK